MPCLHGSFKLQNCAAHHGLTKYDFWYFINLAIDNPIQVYDIQYNYGYTQNCSHDLATQS